MQEYREKYQAIINNSSLYSEEEVEKAKRNSEEIETILKDRYTQFSNIAIDISQSMGDEIGQLFGRQKQSLKEFSKDVIKIVLDALEKIVLIKQQEALIMALSTMNPLEIFKAIAKIAAIKAAFALAKNAATNWWTGGFTGDGQWNQPAGIVHKKEFVANRFAVANPHIRPVLDLVDAAQRSGTVSSLTREDIAAVGGMRSTYSTRATGVISSNQNVSDTQTAAIISTLVSVNRTLAQVKERFDKPIVAETYATGKGGVNEAQKLVNKMEANASRKR